ncbi:hypothetical protein LJC35_00055 [Parabacteroides sp. OttesenSCG-928-N08]|nr:hypothetical protein [Parabacteroides sp. OttesenSCG-928-N08]
MKKRVLNVVITGGKDDYGAWIEEAPEVCGAGATVDEVKQSIQEGLALFLEDKDHIPELLTGDMCFNYRFDISGYIKNLSEVISFAGLHKITGVNQKQLWDYANGYRRPNRTTAEKIVKGMDRYRDAMGSMQLRF